MSQVDALNAKWGWRGLNTPPADADEVLVSCVGRAGKYVEAAMWTGRRFLDQTGAEVPNVKYWMPFPAPHQG